MPTQRRPTRATARGFARLRRQSDLSIEGGVRPLSVYVREDNMLVQPPVAMWIDSTMGLVRSHRLVIQHTSPGNGLTDAVEALVDALASPSLAAGEPGLPTIVRVDDAALAHRVRALLEPLDVPTELVSSLPLLDEAAASLDAHLSGQPDAPPPQPFT